eukprot:352901-Chlamydomonas_euryale.AAC.4
MRRQTQCRRQDNPARVFMGRTRALARAISASELKILALSRRGRRFRAGVARALTLGRSRAGVCAFSLGRALSRWGDPSAKATVPFALGSPPQPKSYRCRRSMAVNGRSRCRVGALSCWGGRFLAGVGAFAREYSASALGRSAFARRRDTAFALEGIEEEEDL